MWQTNEHDRTKDKIFEAFKRLRKIAIPTHCFQILIENCKENQKKKKSYKKVIKTK